jgi:hypothetical protein
MRRGPKPLAISYGRGMDDLTPHTASTSVPTSVPTARGNRGGRPPSHGLNTLKRIADRALDKRTRVSRELEAWRRELVADLGGDAALSAAQRELVAIAARTRLLLDAVDRWLLQQPAVVDRRKRALLPVVRERASLAAGLQSTLALLGLERKASGPKSLADYFATVKEGPLPLASTPAADLPSGVGLEAAYAPASDAQEIA